MKNPTYPFISVRVIYAENRDDAVHKCVSGDFIDTHELSDVIISLERPIYETLIKANNEDYYQDDMELDDCMIDDIEIYD
jgi:hypothetical protein